MGNVKRNKLYIVVYDINNTIYSMVQYIVDSMCTHTQYIVQARGRRGGKCASTIYSSNDMISDTRYSRIQDVVYVVYYKHYILCYDTVLRDVAF